MAVVKNVTGRSLLELTLTRSSQEQIRSIMARVRAMLPVIHAEWGFFGGIGAEQIYYDSVADKITLTDWHRSNLSFKHYPADYHSGTIWPYNHMLKECDDKMYRCCDKLAIFCCFAYCVNSKW